MAKRVLTGNIPSGTTGTSIISDSLEIRQLLTRAAEGKTAVTVKVRGTEVALRGKLLDVDPKTQGIQIALSPGPASDSQQAPDILCRDKLEETFQNAQSRECMLLIYLQGRSIVGLNAEPSELRDDRMIFSFPPKLFKIQRRKSVRFMIPQGYEYTIELESIEQPGTRVRKRLIDISESGLSFFVLSPREAAIFRTGLIIRDCFIQVQQHQLIPVIIRVCNHSSYDRGSQGSGNKVGVEFEQISAENKAYLSQFVYSHAQHLFY